MNKTKTFRVIVGIAEGYFHNTKGVADNELVAKVAKLWQEIAKNKFEENDVYISATVWPGSVVYHENWGCPSGGESVVVISGTANPTFVKNLDEWEKTVIEIAKEVKDALKQSTLSVEFWDSDLIYLT